MFQSPDCVTSPAPFESDKKNKTKVLFLPWPLGGA